jgi:hypothetical protein
MSNSGFQVLPPSPEVSAVSRTPSFWGYQTARIVCVPPSAVSSRAVPSGTFEKAGELS